MAAMVTITPKTVDADYRKWAMNLVGRDWEIFWREEEDGIEGCAKQQQENPDTANFIFAATTSSGQETAEEEKTTTAAAANVAGVEQGQKNNTINTCKADETTDDATQSQTYEIASRPDQSNSDQMEINLEVCVVPASSDVSLSMMGGKEETISNENEERIKVENNDRKCTLNTDNRDEGSIIDDWYDGHVLETINETSTIPPIEGNGWKFRVRFVGDEDIYDVYLVPSKVRPSARAWIQRTVALLNPPITAAGENNIEEEEESNLPPDTSTLDDIESLRVLKSKIIDAASVPNGLAIEKNDSLASLPTYRDFRRIQILRYHLESQIYLRQKLSKIENHSGKELFTDGVRNPTESYVNYLVQCCKDLAQACLWYSNSWKLLLFYFGNPPPAVKGVDSRDGNGNINNSSTSDIIDNKEGEPERAVDLGKLTFQGLITNYLEFGKDTIINTAMIDTTSSGPSGKRRQAKAPTLGSSSNRRTKRRRKLLTETEAEEESDGEKSKVLAAASKVDADILSVVYIDDFIATVSETIHYRHIATLGNILQSLSHLVVKPLISWKVLAGRILGVKNNNGSDVTHSMFDRDYGEITGNFDIASCDNDDGEIEEMFTYEQIQLCLLSMRSNSVLSRFNLFDDVHKIHAKLGDIEKNHGKALSLFKSLASTTATSFHEQSYNKKQDKTLSGLTAILKQLNSPESSLYNVNQLSSKEHTSIITRVDLSKAITLRAWFVDAQHAQSVRERNAFVQNLVSQIEPINGLLDSKDASVLVNLPQISQWRDASIQRILKTQAIIKNSSDDIEKREKDFLRATGSVDVSNILERNAHLALLHSIFAGCKEYPVILPFEENIAARIDLIEWYVRVNLVIFSRLHTSEKNNTVSFFDLENQYESLQAVLRGASTARANLIKGLESNSNADEMVCRFLSSDIHFNCRNCINEATQLYYSASSWKERAESVIFCLRMHGNVNAGESTSAQKLPAMVDIKRVIDLVEEYPGLQIKIHGYIELLKSIQSEAFQWSQNIHTTLLENDNVSFTDALSFMEKEREQRPKGIIVNPNRSVVDATIDLLAWYGKIKSAANVVAGSLKQSSIRYDTRTIAAAYSNLIISEFYPILADGSEALEIYCGFDNIRNGVSKLKANSDRSLETLDTRFHIRKTSRALSAEKINSNELVSSLFLRMNSKDDKEGFLLLLILWFHWHLSVDEFVFKCKNDENSDMHQNQVLSLVHAKQLRAQNPFLSLDVNLINDPNTRCLIETKSTQLMDLDRSIEEAQKAELVRKEGLAKAKDLLRGSLLEKGEDIREHFNNLKIMLSLMKARSLGKGGLSINEAYESPLEQHIKYFTWLVRTLQYPVLHEGEASFSSPSNANNGETSMISWDALVNLHERIPNAISGSGAPILCILRVRELYKTAKKWQDEVCRSTMISKRGNKRRGAKASYQQNSTEKDNKDKYAKIRMREIETLAEDPILTKVEMPRHKAVKTMLDTSRKFEIQLENFFAQDFDGNQDNAPLPKGDSLVGRKGQFILYRLTGSSLFLMMQTSVQSLSEIGNDVLAETRGKAAFDWMRSAVEWIEDLQHAVVSQPKFIGTKENILVIPGKHARELCISGEHIFLQTNKDMTQTFSNHGIYVSTNSIKKRLIVKLKKDGAHHSVGGIIIRWCPILFNALRADVSKLELWESGLKKVIYDFETFQSSSSQIDAINDEEHLFQWFCYGNKVRTALEEGQNSLVVSPSKDAIEHYTNILGTITKYLNKNCSHQLNKAFSKRLFANNSSLYDSRFELLDALLYRRKSASNAFDDTIKNELQPLEPEISSRDKCRSNLENALLRAATAIGLEPEGMPNVEDLCALKAWEIENEMFEIFQGVFETTQLVSEDYRGKARSLKSNLENTGNISLCLNVLIGDIKVNALVKMTPEQLANEKTKLERERADVAALKYKVLTPGVEDLFDTGKSRDHSPSGLHVRCARPLPSILRNKGTLSVVRNDSSFGPETKITAKLNIDDNYQDDKMNVDENADGAPTIDDSDEEELVEPHSKLHSPGKERSKSSLSSASLKFSPSPRSLPPPPPPSLVSSFNTSTNGDSNSSCATGALNEDRGIRISNAFGGKSFRIEIQGREKYAFLAAFYQEDESQALVNRYMSESLVQKGRSKIDDFHSFVSEKLRGGRWQATCLRMATISAKDAGVYREFYKEYETKERIAMFKLYGESGSKLFLVTPKFHQIARQSREIRFGNKNSTYAIVLTKKDEGDLWID